jgi:ornithine carbamoyltransferase
VPRHFLTGAELGAYEIRALLERALDLKRERAGGAGREPSPAGRAWPLRDRSVALLFDQPSTRTRLSFEVGVAELGGTPIVVSGADLQLARGESLRDTAMVMSRYVDAIGVRTAEHATLEELAAHSEVPVVNMLTRAHHPCQALADLVTLLERFGRTDGLKLAYLGDGNNVASSLMTLGAAAGLKVVIATPPALAPAEEIVRQAEAGAATDGSVRLTDDPEDAARDADALYTDVWVSMGADDGDGESRRELLDPYRLDGALLDRAGDGAIALHCLPAHPGEEITAEVLYGPRSAVWDQAENRLHAQKALLELLVE